MKQIDDKSIDAIIADLPYGQTARNKWDSVIPFNDYVIFKDKIAFWKDFIILGWDYKTSSEYWNDNKKDGLWTHYERIIKDNGAIILFANGMFTADLMQSNRKIWRYNLI